MRFVMVNRKWLLMLAAASVLTLGTTAQASGPYSVGATPKEPDWSTWGYALDGQTWANWLAVNVPWGTEAAMSGNYVINQDFLFRVDPTTSGPTDPVGNYDANWWNHDDVYGLGEFFDAGSASTDQNYYLALSLGATDSWAVWYDADRDLINDGGSEHALLGGTVSSYESRSGCFYGILQADPAEFAGYYSVGHDEGTPDLVNSVFHAGNTGEPIPEPGTLVLLIAAGLGALAYAWRRRRS